MPLRNQAPPDPSPRKRAPKRYFKGLMMLPVSHPPGALAESCALPPNPANRRMAKIFLSVAGAIVFATLLLLLIYKKPKIRKVPVHPTVSGSADSKSPSGPTADKSLKK